MVDEPLRTAIINHYESEYLSNKPLYEPDAKVISGNVKYDSWIYMVEQSAGIEMDHANNKIRNYRIVDESKYSWFLLKWT